MAPAITDAVKLIGDPAQTGLLLLTVGGDGVGADVITTVFVLGGHPEAPSETDTT